MAYDMVAVRKADQAPEFGIALPIYLHLYSGPILWSNFIHPVKDIVGLPTAKHPVSVYFSWDGHVRLGTHSARCNHISNQERFE